MYELIKTGRTREERRFPYGARRYPDAGIYECGYGGCHQGAVSTEDLEQIKCQVELSNTYHLHVRTGDKLIKGSGRTAQVYVVESSDSYGFRRISGVLLAGLRKIKEEGVYFHSRILTGQRFSWDRRRACRSSPISAPTIAMAFDECPAGACRAEIWRIPWHGRRAGWSAARMRCSALNGLEDTVNRHQMLFGINQGAIYTDIRIDHAKRISEMDLDGYAVSGLAVGETHEEMYHVLDETVPYLPGEQADPISWSRNAGQYSEGVERGIDSFDCVYPSRNGRHGHVYTNQGKINLFNQKYERKICARSREGCGCPTCRRYSRAYIRHLLKAKRCLACAYVFCTICTST